MKPWQQTFGGHTWRQMPGQDSDAKKLNFALLRLGRISLDDLSVPGERMRKVNHAALTRQRALQRAKREETARDEQWTLDPAKLAATIEEGTP